MGLLTVRAVANRPGVGYSTVKHWIYKGRIRTRHTPGGHHRIAEAEVEGLGSKTDAPVPGTFRVEPRGPIVALGGRTRLYEHVDEVRTGGLAGQVRLRVGDRTMPAVITADAIRERKLRRGDEAMAILTSTDVMIAKQAPLPRFAENADRPRRRRG